MRDDNLDIAAMGPAGSYSEAAARKYAGLNQCASPRLVFGPIEQCLAMVGEARVSLAVVPGENMVDGLIGPTFDALIELDGAVQVSDELHLPVAHVLATWDPGYGLAEIRRVYSHPSPLNQCARNLYASVPEAVLIPSGSTSEAAAHLLQSHEPGAAAICSEETAKALHLHILKTNFGDYAHNQTRFLICSKASPAFTGRDRTLIAVRYGRNEAGQLYRTAGAFAQRRVDLCSVHSRPYKIRPQEYVLLFEVVGHATEPNVAEALAEIRAQVGETRGFLRVLGSFPRRETP